MRPKTVLITGASSGFGKITIPLLLKKGHTVIAALRGGRTRLVEHFEAELQAYPDRLIALDLHLEKPESIQLASQLVTEKFGGKLDVLINNAGYGLFGATEDQTLEQIRHQFEVGFFGPIALTQALLPALRASRGRVICMSSVAGLYSYPLYGMYSASKFALEGWAESLHYDLRPLGVQVSLVEPGGFKTDFSTRSRIFGAKSNDPHSPYAQRSQALDRFLTHASPRLGNPLRVAKVLIRLTEKSRIPLRTTVGPDAKFMVVLGRLLPEGLRLWLVDRAFRFILKP